ncbi:hypothetical protein [Isoptericola croceus]|nr:hypothetical protein [Isoptericola croceus]
MERLLAVQVDALIVIPNGLAYHVVRQPGAVLVTPPRRLADLLRGLLLIA